MSVVPGLWHVRQLPSVEAVEIQYLALGAVRIKSEVRSKAHGNAKAAPRADPIPAVETMNSRRDIMTATIILFHLPCQTSKSLRVHAFTR